MALFTDKARQVDITVGDDHLGLLTKKIVKTYVRF
jgi:hypothetical protein